MGGTGMLKIAPKTVSSALCCNGGSFFRLPALMRYIRQCSQEPLTASLRGEAMEQMVCNLKVQETSVHVNNIKSESCFRAEQYRCEREHRSDHKNRFRFLSSHWLPLPGFTEHASNDTLLRDWSHTGTTVVPFKVDHVLPSSSRNSSGISSRSCNIFEYSQLTFL